MTETWPPLDGDPLLDLAESGDVTPRLLRESADGRAASYGYRGFRFTIERHYRTWWCHGGASRPGDMLALCHEAGFASLTRRRIVAKVRRAVDGHLRTRGRRAEVRP